MHIKQFDFQLPSELIAQHPLSDRSASRLLHIDRDSKRVAHRRFADLPQLLRAGDVLILNDTKVMPARLIGTKADTGGKVEVLLLKRLEGDRWETLVKPGKRIRPGTRLTFGSGRLEAECLDVTEAGGRVLRLSYEGVFEQVLAELGQMPLPPYIKAQVSDQSRYQTVYARHEGSAAAPTAGLHFTEELLQSLANQGVSIGYITLHVGLDTFRPVQTERIEDHQMHTEFYQISAETAQLLNQAQAEGRRIIAVGTTSVRTLETIAQTQNYPFRASSGWSDLFIHPGFQFRLTEGMITNFHLPRSSLLLLVSAFLGRESLLNAYQEAIKERYRFYSFGDAMLII